VKQEESQEETMAGVKRREAGSDMEPETEGGRETQLRGPSETEE